MYPEGHPYYVRTQSDLVYWAHWFSYSKKNRRKQRFPKGFIEIEFYTMESLISEKAARVLDLLEQIESVNEMIHMHEGDTFMQGQYQYRKQLFVQELAGRLKEFEILPRDLAA